MTQDDSPAHHAAPIGKRSPSFTHHPLNLLHWIISIAVLFLILWARVHLLSIPLERDEGEYGYVGQIMLQGIPPYFDADNMKMPGTYAAYALIMSVFGQTPQGVHTGLLLVNLLSIVLMFFLARSLSFPSGPAALSAALLGTFTLGTSVLGFAAHATQFVLPFVLGGTGLLLSNRHKKSLARVFIAGVLFGCAFVMKQHGGLFFPMAALMLLLKPNGRPRYPRKDAWLNFGVLTLGAALPLGIVFALMAHAGVLESFLYWTFNYAGEYVREITITEFFANLFFALRMEILSSPAIWITAIIGMVCLLVFWKKYKNSFYVLLLVLFGFLSVCPGGYFRNHYFITLAPAIVLLSLYCVRELAAIPRNFRSPHPIAHAVEIAMLLLLFGLPFWSEAQPYFFEDTVTTSKIIYGSPNPYVDNPFCEAIQISRYIREHSAPSDKIVVLGCEPEIYFLSQRHSATSFLYLYPLIESQPLAAGMQDKLMAEISSSQPAYIVYDSWMQMSGSAARVTDWFMNYAGSRYDCVGVVDLLGRTSHIAWLQEVGSYTPRSERFLLILKRKDLAG